MNLLHYSLISFACSVCQWELSWRMEGGHFNPPLWPREYHGFGAIEAILENRATKPARYRVLIPAIYRLLTQSKKLTLSGLLYVHEPIRFVANTASLYFVDKLWGYPGILALLVFWLVAVQSDYVESQVECALALWAYSTLGTYWAFIPAVLWALNRESAVLGLLALTAVNIQALWLVLAAGLTIFVLRTFLGTSWTTGMPFQIFEREITVGEERVVKKDIGCLRLNLESIKFALSRKQYTEPEHIQLFPVPGIAMGVISKPSLVWYYNSIFVWMALMGVTIFALVTNPPVGLALFLVTLFLSISTRIIVELRLFACVLPLLLQVVL